MDLSIVIVNYNSLELLKACLSSISAAFDRNKIKTPVSHEVVIVDNHSIDGSIQYLRNRKEKNNSKNLKLIECRENTGFSRASNLGARSSSGDFLLFLNPDTELEGGDFSDVLAFLKDKDRNIKTGAVGVKTINRDGSLQYSCRSFPTLARQFYESYFLHRFFRKSKVFGSYFMTFWDHDNDMEVDWLSGSFMLIKRNLFNEIGCFDEDYFIYSEDTDLCFRLNRKGYRNYYCSRYRIIHDDAAVASRDMALRESQLWKSRRLYFLKNYSVAHAKVFSFLYFLYIFNRITVFAALTVFKKDKDIYRSGLTDYSNALKLYFSGK